jgi:hypothetical protein
MRFQKFSQCMVSHHFDDIVIAGIVIAYGRQWATLFSERHDQHLTGRVRVTWFVCGQPATAVRAITASGDKHKF